MLRVLPCSAHIRLQAYSPAWRPAPTLLCWDQTQALPGKLKPDLIISFDGPVFCRSCGQTLVPLIGPPFCRMPAGHAQVLAGKLKPNLGRFENPPDWAEILTNFRGSELQNYFTRVLEDNLKVG